MQVPARKPPIPGAQEAALPQVGVDSTNDPAKNAVRFKLINEGFTPCELWAEYSIGSSTFKSATARCEFGWLVIAGSPWVSPGESGYLNSRADAHLALKERSVV